jgi:hypothetical protein
MAFASVSPTPGAIFNSKAREANSRAAPRACCDGISSAAGDGDGMPSQLGDHSGVGGAVEGIVGGVGWRGAGGLDLARPCGSIGLLDDLASLRLSSFEA